MRMLLSSCSAQRSASEGLGTLSRSHASEILLFASEICFEEVLRHVLEDACEQVHLEYRNTGLETPASKGRGQNSVRIMKEMVQRQKDAVFSLCIEFSIKHPLFALLVRHSEWILNHLVRNAFVVEMESRVIKTSPFESHTWKS